MKSNLTAVIPAEAGIQEPVKSLKKQLITESMGINEKNSPTPHLPNFSS